MIEEIIDYAQKNDIPIIQQQGLTFLLSKIDEFNIVNVLEVGSAIGYSAIEMALYKENILITTLEKDIKRYNLAVKNISDNNLDKRVKIINIDANDYKSDIKYDMIFLDGPKSQYENMLNHLFDNLALNGIVVVDNLGFYGLVYEERPKVRRRTRQLVDKIKLFREHIVSDERFEVIFYDDIGDGMGLIIKRKEV